MHLCLMHDAQLIKGTLKTIILKLLSEHGRMYGYEITRTVEKLTDGQLVLTEGALYPTLHKLEAEGWVVTQKEQVGGRMRKYYALTPSGDSERASKLREFDAFVNMMRLILRPVTP